MKGKFPAPFSALVVVLVTVVALSVSGCLGGSNTTTPPSGTTTVNIVVSGYQFAFSPSSVTIHLGENMTWVNNAGVDHTITSDNATDPFSSGILPTGHSFTHEFNLIGVFPYHCSIHAYMTVTVTVMA